MSLDIYTVEEVIDFIKEIDIKLNQSLKSSKLDTGQASQDFSIDVAELTKQRNYWVQIWRSKTGNDGGIVSLQGGW